MSCVYRYIDVADRIIKYVGIVWSETRDLQQRINEHRREPWYKNSIWRIEYLDYNIKSRTDAEYIESHLISLYQTDRYYNVSKAGWGKSSFIEIPEDSWKEYHPHRIKRKVTSKKVQTNRLNKLDLLDRYLEFEYLFSQLSLADKNFFLNILQRFENNDRNAIYRFDEFINMFKITPMQWSIENKLEKLFRLSFQYYDFESDSCVKEGLLRSVRVDAQAKIITIQIYDEVLSDLKRIRDSIQFNHNLIK